MYVVRESRSFSKKFVVGCCHITVHTLLKIHRRKMAETHFESQSVKKMRLSTVTALVMLLNERPKPRLSLPPNSVSIVVSLAVIVTP